jgi:hypothetical protein
MGNRALISPPNTGILDLHELKDETLITRALRTRLNDAHLESHNFGFSFQVRTEPSRWCYGSEWIQTFNNWIVQGYVPQITTYRPYLNKDTTASWVSITRPDNNLNTYSTLSVCFSTERVRLNASELDPVAITKTLLKESFTTTTWLPLPLHQLILAYSFFIYSESSS